MAEENQAQATEAKQGGSSANSVIVLGIVVVCILAVFMITSLNKMKMEMIELNRQVKVLVTTTAENSMAGYQAVDKDGKVQTLFMRKPIEKMMEESDLLRDQ